MLPSQILSQRVQSIKEPTTLAITAKAGKYKAEGRLIIGLAAGEPDFDTPQHIKDAAIAAINAGHTKYTPVSGIPALKHAIVNKFKTENGFDYAVNEVIVGVGGKQTIFNLCLAVLNKGDEGITISTLRPIGKAEFRNGIFEVKTYGNYLEQGQKVRIIQVDASQIIVEPLN